MQIDWIAIAFVLFAEGLVVSLILTPVLKRQGAALGLIDAPGERKVHTEPTPLTGGLSVFLSFLIVAVVNLLCAVPLASKLGAVSSEVSRLLPNVVYRLNQLGLIMLGAAALFFTGLIDDRRGLNPWLKLAVQALSALPLYFAGVRIVLFLNSPLASFLLTAVWVVLLTNSFNFLDNMDGLASGIAAIILGALGMLSLLAEEWFMLAIIMALLGAVLGFWRYNFFGHRVFLGDSGSLFIGYMIAAITILMTYYKAGVPTALPVLSPLIILGVPIFDTLSVMLIRLKSRKPLMKGDTNHFSHRLVSLGMTKRQAVVFIYLVTICVCLNALPLRYLDLRNSIIVAFQTILIFVIIYLLEKVGKNR